ncbi:RnfABCDGE type electron transport complex subunit B [Marichromatium gracile]|uniref:Ion-translocating oxidoreductase complex subunit B n=2 Tax=Marichromatium gracile TaxID=1048 RepID=A0ABR5VIU2_MARGR|nr:MULTISPECIES: RnfABCDGE type electron transport complex subunit B [Marichromatium]MBO8085329.1 RnfABCDGE type electron transport complex subunit B [Marichromatium sp.]KXX65640.1 Fe-S cluster protein [Marichromatium gracile]MBK1709500.1 Fe-S cluster protein [Marichromatium gracile]MCF1184698.1 RnfABCDGE type electron transport complex subunit B [Marichromatium gracile]RNE88507.1 RnfABCDGE type electron transport complex subunit B [Marichromatium sp. AB31]
MATILTAVGFMAALGLMLALMLVVANRRFYVYEDPRIDQVEDLLPKANCGACGEAGCRTFAELLVKGEVEPGKCTVNAKDTNQIIADFLGVSLGNTEKRVARLACAGGDHVAYIRASYGGISSCRAAALVGGGGKGCSWGCLGMGDCVEVCQFGALSLDAHGLPVVDEDKCTACGDCVSVCPKDLFSIHPVSHRLWVACKSLDAGDEVEHQCEVACTACGRCVQDSPEGLIEIRDNLAVLDYDKNALASKVAIERCPTGAIVWLEPGGAVTKGRDARKVVRKAALPMA